MNVDSIQNGYVIDHIQAGRAMEIYNALELQNLDCSVAILMNVPSSKMGHKDIIKIDKLIRLNFTAIGYIDPGITVNIINNGSVQKRRHGASAGAARCTALPKPPLHHLDRPGAPAGFRLTTP